MKKTLVFGGLLLFLFVGFQPPAGMRKLPSANIEFQEPASGFDFQATVPDSNEPEAERS